MIYRQFENLNNVILPVMWLNESAKANQATINLLKKQVCGSFSILSNYCDNTRLLGDNSSSCGLRSCVHWTSYWFVVCCGGWCGLSDIQKTAGKVTKVLPVQFYLHQGTVKS